jgi:AcrR family transcriptional regulator
MKIAELERVSGVHRSTIHHYLNVGLLPRPRVAGPKLHLFGGDHASRLEEIQTLRTRGWSIAKIREHLSRPTVKTRPRLSKADASAGPRVQILREATRLFAERGYHDVRLIDIARALGIGKATIYRYFPSKQALFVDCVENVRFTLVPKQARDQSMNQTKLQDQGRQRALAVLHNFAAYRTMNHLLGSLSHGGDAELAARAKVELHAMITNAEPLLRKLMAMNQTRGGDSELMAYMLWGALMGAGERLGLDGKYTLDQVLDAYLAFTNFGLFGRKKG